MGEINQHKPGTFCWAELVTTDASGAKEFYSNLFGWNPNDLPLGDSGTYTMLQIDGKEVAALHQMQSQMREQGIPPHWLSYVSVASADEAAAKATSLNGKVLMEPFDVMDAGRMAVLQDPTGAVMAVWQPKNHIGARLVDQTGTVAWTELATPDAKAAGEFYSGIFGWSATEQNMGSMTYTIFGNDDKYAGGMMQMTEEWAGIPPHWMPYIAVENADATAQKTTELGGTVKVPPSDIPGVGRFAVLQDPQGAVISILQPAA